MAPYSQSLTQQSQVLTTPTANALFTDKRFRNATTPALTGCAVCAAESPGSAPPLIITSLPAGGELLAKARASGVGERRTRLRVRSQAGAVGRRRDATLCTLQQKMPPEDMVFRFPSQKNVRLSFRRRTFWRPAAACAGACFDLCCKFQCPRCLLGVPGSCSSFRIARHADIYADYPPNGDQA